MSLGTSTSRLSGTSLRAGASLAASVVVVCAVGDGGARQATINASPAMPRAKVMLDVYRGARRAADWRDALYDTPTQRRPWS
jgi:hypothetical protein